MRKPLAASAVALLLVVSPALLSFAQSAASHQHPGGHSIVTPDQVKWGPAPPALPPGAQAALIEGDMDHYVRAKGETTVQIPGMGPFELKYANPADDPRQKTAEGKNKK